MHLAQMKLALLLVTLLLAMWFDFRERRIPNILIIFGIAGAVAINVIEGGLSAIGSVFAGLAAGLFVLVPFFALRLVGAGDVKLMGVVGGYVGIHALLPISLYLFIAGGVLSIASVLLARSGHQVLRNLHVALLSLVARAHGSEISLRDLGLRSAARIPYAFAISAGVFCWLLSEGWQK